MLSPTAFVKAMPILETQKELPASIRKNWNGSISTTLRERRLAKLQ